MASSENSFIDATIFQQMADLALTAEEIVNLEIIIDSVMDIMEQFCGRKLKARDFSSNPVSADYDFEYSVFDGPKEDTILRLPTYPINSITTLTVDGVVVTAATDYEDSTGYFLYPHNGKIYYSYGFSYGYRQNIKIDWNGGYGETHKSYITLQRLAYLITKKLWDESSNNIDTEMKSERIGNYSYTKMSSKEMSDLFGLPLYVFVNLGRFKRITIG